MPARPEYDFRVAISVAGVLLVTVLVYWPGLAGPLLLDDYAQLRFMSQDPLLLEGTWRSYVMSTSGPGGRPIAMLSFLFSAILSGAEYWYWKLANLLIHAGTGLLVFMLSWRLLSVHDASPSPRWLALLVAALWLLHPLQVSTVLYTVQRMSQLSAMFVFAGLLSYVEGRTRQLVGRPGALAVGFGLLVCYPLAALCKENGALLPFFVLLIETGFFGFKGSARVRRSLIALITILALLPALLALQLHLDGRLLGAYEFRSFSIVERLLTEGRAVVYYLYQLLVPLQANMGFYYDDFPVSKGLFSPVTTVGALAVLAALAAGCGVAWRRNRLFAVGMAVFLLGHTLEASGLPLELVFEHRNYLPAYGVFIALAGLAEKAVAGRAGGFAICVVLLLFTGLTAARVNTWSSAEQLHGSLHAARPGSWRAASVWSEHLRTQGAYQQAYAVVDEYSGAAAAAQRAVILCSADRVLPAQAFRAIVVSRQSLLDSTIVDAVLAIGRFGLDGACQFPLAAYLELVDRVLSARLRDLTGRHKLLVYKARFLLLAGERDAAIASLDGAMDVWPDDPYTYLLAVEWSLDSGKSERARQYLVRLDSLPNESRLPYRAMIGWMRDNIAAVGNE